MSKVIATVSLVVILGLVNWSILGKEKHLEEGHIVYLHTAPVDPRSLMQGDYMTLRFQIAREVRQAQLDKLAQKRTSVEGFVIVRLDGKRVGTFARLYEDGKLAENEVKMRYRVRGGQIKLASNAFFFQEGHGPYYEPARFGEFRVDSEGALLLTGMFDAELNRLGAEDVTD